MPNRRLSLETLEPRYAMTADVNGDGVVVPLDALLIANAINSQAALAANPSLDVNADGSLSRADFDAVISELGQIHMGNADSDVYQAEGDVELPYVGLSASHSELYEMDETSVTITVTRYTENIETPLEVFFAVAGVGVDAASSSDYTITATGSVTIPAWNHSTQFQITAVDDEAIERTERLGISLSTSTTYSIYSPGASAYLDIHDDEWRWWSPSTDEWSWLPAQIAIEIAGWNGTLDGNGYAEVLSDRIQNFDAWANALYSFSGNTFTASPNAGVLSFACDSQTGDIWVTDFPSDLVDNQDWASAAIGYSYQIDDDLGPTHTVDIEGTFAVGAGGTFTEDHSAEQDSGSGTYEPWTGVKTGGQAARIVSSTYTAQLRCKQEPEPANP